MIFGYCTPSGAKRKSVGRNLMKVRRKYISNIFFESTKI